MIKLEENEKVVKVFRKHWLILFIELFLLILAGIAPLFLFSLLRNNILFDLTVKNIYFLNFLYIIFLIILWILGNILWLNYYLDMWLLTNKRLINIEQKSLFAREISSLNLDRIQDITIEILGLINTLLKIGNVHVQTASAQKEFTIDHASNPHQVKQEIISVANSYTRQDIR